MKPDHYYMHKDAMDVCIYVQKSFRVSKDRFNVKASTWNLGYMGLPWRLDEPKNYKITNPSDWVRITHQVFDKRTTSK